VPAPRADLAATILTAAQSQTPVEAANDRKPFFSNKGVWSAAAGIAATLVAGFFVMNSQPDEAELWAAQADLAGFGDLYEWVYEDLE
jgi:copper(I)-binding protein